MGSAVKIFTSIDAYVHTKRKKEIEKERNRSRRERETDWKSERGRGAYNMTASLPSLTVHSLLQSRARIQT